MLSICLKRDENLTLGQLLIYVTEVVTIQISEDAVRYYSCIENGLIKPFFLFFLLFYSLTGLSMTHIMVFYTFFLYQRKKNRHGLKVVGNEKVGGPGMCQTVPI
jgi:hypothetical protein